MTLDELKGYEDEVANHRTLPAEVMQEVFALARGGINVGVGQPVFETAPAVPKRAKKAAE